MRKAIATAVDRQAVTEAARFGAARANQTAIPKSSFFYYDYAPYTPDQAAAQQLVQRAGVQTPLRMGLMVTDQYPETVTAAQVIASELEPIGIDVEVQTVDFATWLDREAKGDFDAFLLGWLGNVGPGGLLPGPALHRRLEPVEGAPADGTPVEAAPAEDPARRTAAR